MYFLNNRYVDKILSMYRTHMELIDSFSMGFTGTLGERPAVVSTNEISEDALYVAAGVNFLNATSRVRLKTLSPQYEWMADHSAAPVDTPICAIAGMFSNVLPIVALIRPFFVKAQGKIQHQFTNAVAPETAVTGGVWTWRGLRLTDPIDGFGWDYSVGLGLT